jgi:hypothetical protein
MTREGEAQCPNQCWLQAISSLLKNLVYEAFLFSVLSFRWFVREWFGFFYLPSRLVEAKCHVLAIRFRNRHRLSAAQ